MKEVLLLVMGLILLLNSCFAQYYERYKKLTDTTLLSTHLGYKKHISVVVPIEWQKTVQNEFPLIVIFDRQRRVNHNYILQTIDYLTTVGQIPASIIVSIESEQTYRYWETLMEISNEKSKGFANEHFLFEELIPLAERQFKASSFRMFIGHSRHAYYATNLFYRRTNDLNAVIALSPFFYEGSVHLVDSISTLNERGLQHKAYYRYAIGNDYPNQFEEITLAESSLFNQQIDIKGRLLKQADHYAIPGLAIASSLYEVFEFWSEKQLEYLYQTNSITNERDSFEKEMLQHYGVLLNCSFEIMNARGWHFFEHKNYAQAIRVWKELLETYPNFSEAYLYILEGEKALGKVNRKMIKAFRKSLATSNFYSEFKKLDLLNDLKELIDN